MFLYLGFEVVDGLLNLVENASPKGNILDDIHIPAYFLLCIIGLEAERQIKPDRFGFHTIFTFNKHIVRI